MSSLRADAVAAYQATQSDRESEARAALAAVLTPEDVSALKVVDVDTAPTYARYVLTDSDVYLAVVLRKGGNEVRLVSGKPGEWTVLGDPITSLSMLGKVLPGLVPPPPPKTGPAPWAPGVKYKVGDKVTYSGVTYSCVQAHGSQLGWEPPNVPALWKAAS